MADEKKELTLAEEAGLPNTWHPVESQPINPVIQGAPNPNPMAPYFDGSISPNLQHDAVFVGTKYGTHGIPILPLMPIAPAGNASVNSGSQTIVKIESSSGSTATPPAGASTDVQINLVGSFYADGGFTYTPGTGVVAITGKLNTGAAINSAVGFEIGGIATAGNYLRGDGVNFVSHTLAAGDLTGIVTLAHGGTGVDLSATGGAHQVLRQSSVGANVTVSQLAFSDLSGSVTPAQFVSGSANLTTQTANIAATTLLATGTNAGLYVITVYMIVSQAATSSSTLPDSRLIWTDQDSGATITAPVTPGLSTNTTSTFAQATFIVNAKASTNIQFDVGQITAYASSGATPMQFSYRARAVYLG